MPVFYSQFHLRGSLSNTCPDYNQGLLHTLGVSHPALQRVIDICAAFGEFTIISKSLPWPRNDLLADKTRSKHQFQMTRCIILVARVAREAHRCGGRGVCIRPHPRRYTRDKGKYFLANKEIFLQIICWGGWGDGEAGGGGLQRGADEGGGGGRGSQAALDISILVISFYVDLYT